MSERKTRENCWEYLKCGRQPQGHNVEEFGECPAALEERLDGEHGGVNAGRACWVVAGTLCGGEVQGTFAEKYKNCKECDFYKKVDKEEYPNFQLSASLISELKKPRQRRSKLNCWEFKKCGRQPDGHHVHDLGTCPAALEGRLDGEHDGVNAGRACWAVAGTLCGGMVQGTFAEKYKNCEQCDFYKIVCAEEYPNLQLSAVLRGKLR